MDLSSIDICDILDIDKINTYDGDLLSYTRYNNDLICMIFRKTSYLNNSGCYYYRKKEIVFEISINYFKKDSFEPTYIFDFRNEKSLDIKETIISNLLKSKYLYNKPNIYFTEKFLQSDLYIKLKLKNKI